MMKVAVIVLLSLWSVVESEALTSTGNECKWGVSYWCQSHSTAKLCNKLDYCQSLWKAQPVHDDSCTVCKLVLSLVESYMKKNASEEQAETDVEKFCDALPILQSECKSVVETYFPKIWSSLEDKVDSGEICERLNLCNSSSMVMKHNAILSKAVHKLEDTCSICKLVVSYLKTFITSNGTEQEAEDAIEKLCSILSVIQSECDSIVEKYFPQIWSLLVREIDSEDICKILGLCSNTSMMIPKEKPIQQGTCTICNLVVTFVKPYVESNATQQSVENALEKICDKLPILQSECESMVEKFLPEIWSLLVRKIDSEEICKMLQLCSSTSMMIKYNTILSKEEPVECDICDMAIGVIKPYINNVTKEELEKSLMAFCQFLPSSYRSECSSLVEANFPMIWSLIKENIDDGELCKLLGLCNSDSTQVMINNRPKVKGVVLCAVCNLVMGELDKLLENDKTESAVMNAIEKVCDVLPSEYDKECNDIISKYGSTIYKLIVEGINSKLICGMIGVCTGDSIAVTTTDNDYHSKKVA